MSVTCVSVNQIYGSQYLLFLLQVNSLSLFCLPLLIITLSAFIGLCTTQGGNLFKILWLNFLRNLDSWIVVSIHRWRGKFYIQISWFLRDVLQDIPLYLAQSQKCVICLEIFAILIKLTLIQWIPWSGNVIMYTRKLVVFLIDSYDEWNPK